MEAKVKLSIDSTELDDAIEKANRLAELLKEAKDIIDSLSIQNQRKEMDVKPNIPISVQNSIKNGVANAILKTRNHEIIDNGTFDIK